MGPAVQWVQSYVTADKVSCVYVAPDEAAIREHARRGGFPGGPGVADHGDDRPDDGGVTGLDGDQRGSFGRSNVSTSP
jgi:hypothetical protein